MQPFVGKVDFDGVLIHGGIKELRNEYSEEDETYDYEYIEE